jgi:hypothetical protein
MSKFNLKQSLSGAKDAFSKAGEAAKQAGVNVGYGPGGLSISGNFNKIVKSKVEGNKIKSPLKKLFSPNGGKFTAPLVLPADLDDEHYMVFNIIERNRDQKEAKGTKKVFRSVVLPIPSNLGLSSGVDYQNESLGVFGAMAAGNVNANDLSNAVSGIGGSVSAAINQATNAFKSKDMDSATQAAGILAPAAITGVAAAGAGTVAGLLALGGTSGGVISGISAATGIAVNPHMAVLFKGVGFKEHSFAYKFVARNLEESNRIRDVIAVLQYHMHPAYKFGNLAFQYPDEFEIEFSSKLQPYLFSFNSCVLKNLTVTYNGENTPLFFAQSGAPVSVEIQMQFQETKIRTREDFELDATVTPV